MIKAVSEDFLGSQNKEHRLVFRMRGEMLKVQEVSIAMVDTDVVAE